MAPKKQSVRSNRVCFTLNNYSEEECRALEESCRSSHVVYSVIGKEVASSGTLHLQGFIHLDASYLKAKNGTVSWWKSYPGLSRAHLESARGTDHDSKEYCTKEGDLLLEHGSPALSTGSWKALAEVRTLEEAKQIDPEAYVKNHFQLIKIVEMNRQQDLVEQIPIKVTSVTLLFPWQKAIVSRLISQTSREILFVVDVRGNLGKTYLGLWMELNLRAWRCSGGKATDLMYARKNIRSNYSVFDLSRSFNPDHIPWRFWEDLKNGQYTSTKYSSQTVVCGIQKIVIFMNQMPATRDKISDDRVHIIELDYDKCKKEELEPVGEDYISVL